MTTRPLLDDNGNELKAWVQEPMQVAELPLPDCGDLLNGYSAQEAIRVVSVDRGRAGLDVYVMARDSKMSWSDFYAIANTLECEYKKVKDRAGPGTTPPVSVRLQVHKEDRK